MGFLVGILNGLVVSFQNNQFKRLKDIDSRVLNWFRFVVGSIVLAVFVSIFHQWMLPPAAFWIIFLSVSLPAEMLNAYCYVRAFQLSDQSLVGPLFSLSVIFLIPLGIIFLGEVPSILGLAGIVLVLMGTLLTGWDEVISHIRTTLRSLLDEPGARYMVGAAFFAAIAVTVSKYSYHFLPPLMFAFYITLALALSYTPLILRLDLKSAFRKPFEMFALNGGYGISLALHYFGLSLLPAAYYISVKRSSIIFDVLFGKFIHHELNFGRRLLGAIIMIGGLLLIAFA